MNKSILCILVTLWIPLYLVDAQTQVVMLGTGTPNADPERSGPAVAVMVDGFPYLIDMGPGIVRRVSAANRNGVDSLRVDKLTHVFVTHLHSDHTIGYADLILTPWVLERRKPLHVFGPEGLKSMTEHLLAAYDQDIHMRLYGLEPRDDIGYRVIVKEIQAGEVYRDDRVIVSTIPVPHGSWPQAFGYRFESSDRTIVISGDTTPSQAIIDACNGCDVLVHEVYSTEKFKDRAPEWQRYHAANHTSTEELGEIAKQARPGLLVLYHQLFWGATDEELVDEVRLIYDGDVVSARDLGVY